MKTKEWQAHGGADSSVLDADYPPTNRACTVKYHWVILMAMMASMLVQLESVVVQPA